MTSLRERLADLAAKHAAGEPLVLPPGFDRRGIYGPAAAPAPPPVPDASPHTPHNGD